MGDPRDRWIEKHWEESGDYSCFVGFEEEINKASNELSIAYGEMNMTAKVDLFSLVMDLIVEAIEDED